MFINHHCCECGFTGEVRTINFTVTCPNCKTVNDVWFEGERPPLRHIYQFYYDAVNDRYNPM